MIGTCVIESDLSSWSNKAIGSKQSNFSNIATDSFDFTSPAIFSRCFPQQVSHVWKSQIRNALNVCHYELSNVHTRSWSYQGKEWRDAYCEEARIHFKVFKTGCRHQEPGYLCLESSPSPVPETTFQGNTTAKGWIEEMGMENFAIDKVANKHRCHETQNVLLPPRLGELRCLTKSPTSTQVERRTP